MKDMLPPFFQTDKLNAINESNHKALKQIFKGRINGSFLIKMETTVLTEFGPSILDYYNFAFDSKVIVAGRDETPEYDICRLIVGTHRHYSVFLTKEEIRNNEKSENYQKKLVREVIEKIKLRSYGSWFFRRKQLLGGDEFLYFPVPYELFVLCMQSIRLMADSSNCLAVHYADIIDTALSALTLMENNFLSNAYPLCRSMIEMYLKTLVLRKHPEAEKDYAEFVGYEIDQSCCSQTYSKEFNLRYSNRKTQKSRSKADYLHYGWIDSIDDYTVGKYSIYGIFEYFYRDTTEEQSMTLKKLERLYKMCHGYTHGSAIHVKYPLLQYFEISMMIGAVVRDIFTEISKEKGTDVLCNDISAIELLDRDLAVLEAQYEKRSTENFDLYYT